MPDKSTCNFAVYPVYALGAVALWLLSVLCHDWGTAVARMYFDWARLPGFFHPEGGTPGFVRSEFLLAAALFVLVAAVVLWLFWCLRRLPWAELAALALPWLICLVLLYAAWSVFIVFASELVHFVQYALIGALVALALGRGGRPGAAFLLVVLLGFVDELWQHFFLHRWWLQESRHWLDWSDPVLNALGACVGILPFVTLAAARGRSLEDGGRVLGWAVAVAAAVLLPLAWLDPLTQSQLMGHYPVYPFWNEFANHKAVYWPQPRQGIPVFLVAVLLLGTLLRSGRLFFHPAIVAAVCALLVCSIDPPTRIQGRAVHLEVPTVQVPGLGGDTLRLDGVLDEPVWAKAPRLGPFVNQLDGGDRITYFQDGATHEQALQQTYARLLWDDKALYLAFEVEDDDIWVRPGALDNRDESVTVCLDADGDEIAYYTFSVNAANTVYDYFNLIPAAPMDFNPWNRHLGLPNWDARGLRSAVTVKGTVEQVKRWKQRPANDIDTGYTVEMAIPWKNFSTTLTPGGQAIRQSVHPAPDGRWRLGLFRAEYPRLPAAALEKGATMEAMRGRALLGAEVWDDLVRRGKLRPRAENKDLFSARDVLWYTISPRWVRQAWAPTYNSSFHHPAYYGVVKFVRAPHNISN
jgi:hypothetical protein